MFGRFGRTDQGRPVVPLQDRDLAAKSVNGSRFLTAVLTGVVGLALVKPFSWNRLCLF